jgi:fused signal recognition particle receptor
MGQIECIGSIVVTRLLSMVQMKFSDCFAQLELEVQQHASTGEIAKAHVVLQDMVEVIAALKVYEVPASIVRLDTLAQRQTASKITIERRVIESENAARMQREVADAQAAAKTAEDGRQALGMQLEIFKQLQSSLQEQIKVLGDDMAHISKVKDEEQAALRATFESERKSLRSKLAFEAESPDRKLLEAQVVELQGELQKRLAESERERAQQAKAYEKLIADQQRALAVKKEEEINLLKKVKREAEAEESKIKAAEMQLEAERVAREMAQKDHIEAKARKEAEDVRAAEAKMEAIKAEAEKKVTSLMSNILTII